MTESAVAYARRRLRLAPLWWIGGWVLLALIVYGSLKPSGPVPSYWPKDKVLHFTAYLLLAFWFSGITERRRYPIVAVFLLAVGVAIEYAQGAMGFGRTSDWHDVIANSCGIASGLALAYAGLGSWMATIERRLGLSS